MQWQPATHSHTTKVGTHTIVRRSDVTDEAFMQKMCDEILPSAPIPPLNRVINVVAQELHKDAGDGEGDTYQWRIFWSGIARPELVQRGCEEMYEAVRAELEQIGERTAFAVGSVTARWETQ
jgi:hypothetical protein